MQQQEAPISAIALKQEIQQFRQTQQSLILATDKEQQPLASYAPYAIDEQGVFYLLLSDLAHHSANLRYHQQVQRRVSVLLIEDEQSAHNPFARKRLNYDCTVRLLSREQHNWPACIDLLQQKLGKTIGLLAAMADFNVYALTPLSGSYVRAFGQAYELPDGMEPVALKGERGQRKMVQDEKA